MCNINELIGQTFNKINLKYANKEFRFLTTNKKYRLYSPKKWEDTFVEVTGKLNNIVIQHEDGLELTRTKLKNIKDKNIINIFWDRFDNLADGEEAYFEDEDPAEHKIEYGKDENKCKQILKIKLDGDNEVIFAFYTFCSSTDLCGGVAFQEMNK